MTNLIHTPGSIIAGYKLVVALGEGQGGEVWSAVGKDGGVIAMKLFSGSTPVEVAEKEFRRGLALNHPNILTPFSFGTLDGSAFYTMPLCEGRSADNAAGYFPESLAWELILDIGSALAYLHSMDLCHGDVKPSNILRSGKKFLLADFGSCFEASTGQPSGDLSSYLFSAPESVKTGMSDIWSLGATVFNLVMGNQVFNGLGGRSQREDSEIPYMRKSLPELSAFVAQCLSYYPSSRPCAREVISVAEDNMKRLAGMEMTRPLKKAGAAPVIDEFESFWPELMKEA